MKSIDKLGCAIFKKKPVKVKQKLLIKYLSKKDSTLDALNSYGNTLLSEAVKREDVEVVSLLLEQGAQVNAQNQDKSTALMWAAKQGDKKVLTVLMQKGAKVEIRDQNRDTAISLACQNGYFSIARKLSLYGMNHQGDTPLMRAIQLHYEDLIPEVIEQMAPSALDAQDQLGNTALMLAVRENAKNIVFLLLEKGANLELKNTIGENALALAVQSGQGHMIQLLSHYQSVHDNILEGETLLMSAARCGHDEIIAGFLLKEDQINIQNKKGNTPLLLAAHNGHYNTVLILLAHGAELEIQNKKGETAFLVAAKRGYKDLVTLFLSKDAKILPRTFSLMRKHKKIEQLILRYQTVGLEIENGETPLMRAISLGYLDLSQLWITKAGDLNAIDYDNKTALQRACNQWFRNQEIGTLIKAGAKITPDSQEAQYLKLKMMPLLASCLNEGDMPAALNVLNTTLATYSDPQLAAAAYTQLRNYFLNKPKDNIFERWLDKIKDSIHPKFVYARQAARTGDLYNTRRRRVAYETLITGLVAHTAPVHRKVFIAQLVELSAPQGRDILRQKLCIDYDQDAHLINVPLKVVEESPQARYGQEKKSNLPYIGEAKIGLAWKAKLSNLALGR